MPKAYYFHQYDSKSILSFAYITLTHNYFDLLQSYFSSFDELTHSLIFPKPFLTIPNINIDSHTSKLHPLIVENFHPMITRGKSGTRKPKVFSFVAQLDGLIEPSIVKEALHNLAWLQAMKDEFEALIKNNTWVLVPNPTNEK